MTLSLTKTKSANQVKVEIFPRLLGVSPAQWRGLFPSYPDPPELINLVDQSGMPGFKFHSIVVSCNDKPVLLLPIMQARYPLVTTLDGNAKEIGLKLEAAFPDLLNPTGLFVGFVEGEWGQVGIDPDAAADVLSRAWKLAEKALKDLSRREKVDALAFWQFNQEALFAIPGWIFRDCGMIASQPFCQLAIDFSSLDEYFQSLDSDLQRYLKRVLRHRNRVRIVRTREVSLWSQQIYELYKQQSSGADLSFGQQNPDYFSRICALVPGAEYVLYFDSTERLLGFELLLRHKNRLVSKYFGMEAQAGREYKLYFLSWLENVSYCIDRRIPHFHVGASGEELKMKLGASLMPTAVMLRHQNPLVNFVLKKLQDDLAYESTVPIPKLSLSPRSSGGWLASTAD